MFNILTEITTGFKTLAIDIKDGFKTAIHSLMSTESLLKLEEEKANEIADLRALEDIEIKRIIQEYKDELELGCMGDDDVAKLVAELEQSLKSREDNDEKTTICS